MATQPQVDKNVARSKTVRLMLTEDEWQQVHLVAFSRDMSEQELLTAWIRQELGKVQYLRLAPGKR